jgi:hypothetical protein
MPKTSAELFSAGIFHRDHCVQDPKWKERDGGKEWDTVKPLHGLGYPLDRVLLIDNETHKVFAGEERNAVTIPTWNVCPSGGVDALRGLVKQLLILADVDGTDLRGSSNYVSICVSAANEWAMERERF